MRKRRNESALGAMLPQVAAATTNFCRALEIEFEVEASILSTTEAEDHNNNDNSWVSVLTEAYHGAQLAAAAFLLELGRESASVPPTHSSGKDGFGAMFASLCSGITGLPEKGENASLTACADNFQKCLADLEDASAKVS